MICYINTTSTSAGFCVSTVAHSHNTRDTIFRSLFFSVSSAQSCKQFFAPLILVRFDIARLCRFDVSFSWKQSPRRAPPERTAHVSLHQTWGWKEMRTEVKLNIQKFTDLKEWNVTTSGALGIGHIVDLLKNIHSFLEAIAKAFKQLQGCFILLLIPSQFWELWSTQSKHGY